MKAQTFLEYYLSLIVFAIFATYIFFQVALVLPSHEREIKTQILQAEAYQMSELLITDAGEPSDWNTKTCDQTDCSQVLRIGLLDQSQMKTNFLLQQKIDQLNSICNTPSIGAGYETIRAKLNTADYVSIIIVDKSTNSVVSCLPQLAPTPIVQANMTRLVAVQTSTGVDVAELTIGVW